MNQQLVEYLSDRKIRLETYQIILDDLLYQQKYHDFSKEDMTTGFCYFIYRHLYRSVTDIVKYELTYTLIRYFPELIVYQPAGLLIDDFWFPLDQQGLNQRISILETILSNVAVSE